MASIRVQRLEKELFKLITNVVNFKLRDRKLSFVTITQIKLSQDFAHAKIYFTHMSDFKHDDVLRALQRSSGFIKREIASHKFMRVIPELNFMYDKEAEKIRRLDDIFTKIHNESNSDSDEVE